MKLHYSKNNFFRYNRKKPRYAFPLRCPRLFLIRNLIQPVLGSLVPRDRSILRNKKVTVFGLSRKKCPKYRYHSKNARRQSCACRNFMNPAFIALP
ncbi:MAG TPA: hypothetical protein PLA31_05625, partial [Clostridia bacterium]|nr:hypothetical protein [Clostridia bacterium]